MERLESKQGKYLKAKGQKTVKPVFETLTQFMQLRKIKTLGLNQANKLMQLSAIAFHLKNYLKFIQKRAKSGAKALRSLFSELNTHLALVRFHLSTLNLK